MYSAAAPYFFQAQLVPFDYQATLLRGNATKIDALLLREYLHRGQAIPRAAAEFYRRLSQEPG